MQTFLRASAVASILVVASPAFAQLIGPDDFGHTANPIPIDFVDISATGTDTGVFGDDDGGLVALPPGFGFTLYGSPVSSIGVSTNGYLADDADLVDFGNDCPLANAFDPNSGIYPFWDDLVAPVPGSIRHQTLGRAPERVFVVQWNDVTVFDQPSASLTFQVKLFEAGDAIEFHYENISGGSLATGGSASVGIEDAAGADALEIACSAPGSITSGLAYRIRKQLPLIDGPVEVNPGSIITITGEGEPNHCFCQAYSLQPGPTVVPNLPFDLDLGLDDVVIVNAGETGTSGTFSTTLAVPPDFECGRAYLQAFTFGTTGVAKSNQLIVRTLGNSSQEFRGSVDQAGAADHYTFSGIAGDVVTIELCRTPNLPNGDGSLDPFVCLLDRSGQIAFDDDSGGFCDVPGPFGAALIQGFTLPGSGTYTILASGFQSNPPSGGEVGTYRLSLTGCTGTDLALAQDEGPTCPVFAPISTKGIDPDFLSRKNK